MLSRKAVLFMYEECVESGYAALGEGLFLQSVADMKKKKKWFADEASRYASYNDRDIFLLDDAGNDPIYIGSLNDLLKELKDIIEKEEQDKCFVVTPRFASKFQVVAIDEDGSRSTTIVTGENELEVLREKLTRYGYVEKPDQKLNIDYSSIRQLEATCNSLRRK